MAILTVPIEADGPVLNVFLCASEPQQVALDKAKQQPCPYVHARLLIDTGSRRTIIDPEIIAQLLPVTPTGTVTVGLVNNLQEVMPQYAVGLYIPHEYRTFQRWVGLLPILAGRTRDRGLDGLLGRDVLAGCLFVYNGPQKTLTISF